MHELVENADVVKDNWNGYNVLHDSASRVAALDIGFMPSARSSSAPAPKLVYLLGSDDFNPADVPADAFVIYQVHNGTVVLLRTDCTIETSGHVQAPSGRGRGSLAEQNYLWEVSWPIDLSQAIRIWVLLLCVCVQGMREQRARLAVGWASNFL